MLNKINNNYGKFNNFREKNNFMEKILSIDFFIYEKMFDIFTKISHKIVQCKFYDMAF